MGAGAASSLHVRHDSSPWPFTAHSSTASRGSYSMLSASTWTSSQPVSAWQLWDTPCEPVLPILPTETEATRDLFTQWEASGGAGGDSLNKLVVVERCVDSSEHLWSWPHTGRCCGHRPHLRPHLQSQRERGACVRVMKLSFEGTPVSAGSSFSHTPLCCATHDFWQVPLLGACVPSYKGGGGGLGHSSLGMVLVGLCCLSHCFLPRVA